MHPLKALCLLSWAVLFAAQLGLAWPRLDIAFYWILLAALPLLPPLRGLACSNAYTYRWIGYLALIYFCIGMGELVASPDIRLYGYATSISSITLFLGSIYYARFLRLNAPHPASADEPPGSA